MRTTPKLKQGAKPLELSAAATAYLNRSAGEIMLCVPTPAPDEIRRWMHDWRWRNGKTFREAAVLVGCSWELCRNFEAGKNLDPTSTYKFVQFINATILGESKRNGKRKAGA